jgi:hypothetical protein
MTAVRRVKPVLIGALLLGSSAAAAQPAAPSDCEGIRNDLAYNRCLASFGPKRGERSARETADEADAPAARSAGRAPVLGRNGRQTATFDVVSGRGEARAARGAKPVR